MKFVCKMGASAVIAAMLLTGFSSLDAASNNRIETVKYLLSKGANPNLVATTKDKKLGSYNQGAYSYACTRGHVEMQQLLKANGAINHRTGKASCE